MKICLQSLATATLVAVLMTANAGSIQSLPVKIINGTTAKTFVLGNGACSTISGGISYPISSTAASLYRYLMSNSTPPSTPIATLTPNEIFQCTYHVLGISSTQVQVYVNYYGNFNIACRDQTTQHYQCAVTGLNEPVLNITLT